MTESVSIPARPKSTDAFDREMANDVAYNLGRDEPSAFLRLFQAIARRTAALFSLEAAGLSKARSSSAPETFTEIQARLILSLVKLQERDGSTTAKLIEAFTPSRFTEAQAACVLGLLELDADDFRATLVDAMQPCELRERLRASADAMHDVAIA